MKKIIAALALAMLVLCMALPAGAQVTTGVQNNVLQVATGEGNLKTFTGLVDQAGLRDTLSTGDQYTIFVPTDDAFKKLRADQMAGLTSDKTRLQSIMKQHVVKGRYTTKDMAKMGYLQTLDGRTLRVTSSDHAFAVDNAHIVKTDVPAGNGIIQVIDTVLLPK